MKKNAGKSTDLEPTIADVLEAVQTGFARHEDILTELQTGFARHEKILTTLHKGQELMSARIGDLEHRLTATQSRVEDVAEMLENMTDVVDESRDQIFEHENRISCLEKACA